MADQELIDSIVPNETLGIKKKPSIFKILSVVGILTVVAITSYSLFMKTKQVEAIPPLSLGESVTPITTTEQVQAAVVAETPLNTSNPAVAEPPSGLAPSNPDVNPAQAITATTPSTPAVAATPVLSQAPVATQVVNQVSPAVQVAPAPMPIATQPVAFEQPSPVVAPTPTVAPVLTGNEQIVKSAPIRKPKVAQTKKQVKKVAVAKETQQAHADEYTPKAPVIEEGVTHEEIIIFQ